MTARSGREADANGLERWGRSVSNKMDEAGICGITRHVVHSAWHTGAGVAQTLGAAATFMGAGMHDDDDFFRAGMQAGQDRLRNAGAEFRRAGQHLGD